MMRKYTKKFLDLIDNNNNIDKKTLIRDLLNWMSESDVKQFFIDYELEDDLEDDESEEEYDP
jgi:hypothetical protein